MLGHIHAIPLFAVGSFPPNTLLSIICHFEWDGTITETPFDTVDTAIGVPTRKKYHNHLYLLKILYRCAIATKTGTVTFGNKNPFVYQRQ
jgi:hypothetical protein